MSQNRETNYHPGTPGYRMRVARKVRKMTLAEVGEPLGRRFGDLSRWELGQNRIPLEEACHIADTLGINLRWLADGTGPASTRSLSDDLVLNLLSQPEDV